MASPLSSSLLCLLLTGACWALPFPAAGQQAPSKRKPVGTAPRQTLFPDTLHARPLLVSYWTRAQVDSIQQSLGDNRYERSRMLEDSTGRYRVFRGEDYLDRRLLYCPVSSPAHWIEFDLNPWLRAYNELAYLHAYVVHLDQQAPEEIMVKMGGGIYGSGYRTMIDQTLLLSLDGPPRLLWQSIDGRTEEIPASPDETGEMAGGNYAAYQRTVAMRQGRVYVSPVAKEGGFHTPQPRLTPITPGYYQYLGGRFRRVTAPPKVLKPKKPQPAG